MDKGAWRIIASAALLVYSGLLIPYVRPEPWMVYAWIPLWLGITVPAVIYGIRGGPDAWTRAAMPWSAAIAFTIVAILSAVLESRYYENVGAIFWPLGVGMAGSVALFLSAYDRSKRPPADAE